MFDRRSRAGRATSERKNKASQAIRRTVESLEERQLLVAAIVTNVNDSGVGSLRDAINQVNLDSIGPNTIDFAISAPAGVVQTIAPQSSLPTITQSVTINGYSQPGASPNTLSVGDNAKLLIQVSGQNLSFGNLMEISAGNSTIRGLVLNNTNVGFGTALRVTGPGGNKIEGNFVGTNPAGTAVAGVSTGITIFDSPNNTIGGSTPATRNLISGATGNNGGVFVVSPNATNNVILNNYIGTDASGTQSLGNSFDGIVISDAAGTTVGGLAAGAGNVIAGATNAGIEVFANATVIVGNRIGTNALGTAALGNQADGIILDTVTGATIGGTAAGAGNLLSGNASAGLRLLSSTGVLVAGNTIGLNLAGDTALPNTTDGIHILNSSGNTFGGVVAAARNVISGNSVAGIFLEGASSTGNLIAGNFVGTDVTGAVDLGNVDDGIYILDASANTVGGTATGARNVVSGNDLNAIGIESKNSTASANVVLGNYVGVNAAGTAALGNSGIGIGVLNSPNTTVGGTAAGAGNVVSGNAQAGVGLSGNATTGTFVQGNLIGTNAAGTAAIGNLQLGVGINGSPGNTIGGTTASARNVISGNTLLGVGLTGSTASNNFIAGNFIGTNAAGNAVLANGQFGVGIQDSPNNTIGGASAAAGNLINGNVAGGVGIAGNGATGNRILSNSTFANGGLGIDLNGDGVTNNDPGDADTGPNGLQNFPIVDTVFTVPGGTAVTFTLNSTPNTNFSVQAFLNNGSDPSGFGEGQFYRTTSTGNDAPALTDASGSTTITVTYPFTILNGQSITLTATGPSGGTSEFSNAFTFISSGFVVTNTNDSGPGSLRQVITDANNTAGLQTITFNIPGAGVHTISPLTPLPQFTDPAVVDASTQPGFAGVPIVQVSCVNLGPITSATNIGLFFGTGSGGSTVRGLIINGANQGLRFAQGVGGNKVVGNYFGIDPTGTTAAAQQSSVVFTSSSNNTVGGTTAADRNVIDGDTAVLVSDASTSNVILGNFIATNAAGTASLGTGTIGIRLQSSGPGVGPVGNTIGGLTTGSGNLISPGGVTGTAASFSGSLNNVIVGNRIGTDVTGATKLSAGTGLDLLNGSTGNTIGGVTTAARNVIATDEFGIRLGSASNLVVGNYLGTDVTGSVGLADGLGIGITVELGTGNTIGGAAAGAGNVISSYNVGVNANAGTPSNFVVQGNLIGTNATGTAALGNTAAGINLFGATNVTIGGTAPGAGNLISGNVQRGVQINGGVVSGVLIQGNRIGTNAAGTGPLGNGADGVVTFVTGVTVGGVAAGAGNIIAFNGGNGVTVGSGVGVPILGNSIFGDSKLGIDLGNNGVTPNDPGDGDTGANNLQNFPVITSSTSSPGGMTLSGTLNSTPDTTFTIEAFANAAPDSSGFGEGQQFLGRTTVTTDSLGNTNFGVAFSTAGLVGNSFSATATDNKGNTSEFSGIFTVGPSFVVTNTDDSGTGSLRQVITDANNTPGVQTITFNIDASGVQTIRPLTPLPAITDPVIIDAYTQPGAKANTNDPDLADNAVILVEVSGVSEPAGADAFVVNAGGTTIRGLAIYGFRTSGAIDGVAIRLQSAGNVVEGNFLGTDATGQADFGNFYGVLVDSPNNTIGGTANAARNVIAGNDHNGVDLFASGASNNLIAGNFIGLAADGTTPLGNTENGVLLNGNTNNTVGGTVFGARNVIAANGIAGITLATNGGQDPSSNNLIAGNLIGTDRTGAVAAGNVSAGIILFDGTTANTVGGTVGTAGNLISGNAGDGVQITGAATTGNLLLGNRIGTTEDGLSGLPNGDVGNVAGAGVRILDSPGNTIGGIIAGAGNVVSANAASQIDIAGANARFNVIVGNAIGTDATGNVALSTNRGSGISLGDGGTAGAGASDNTIGGTVPGAGNLISGNGNSDFGIVIGGNSTTRNVVQGNLIGVNVSSTAALPNGHGIGVGGGAFANTIGGSTTGAGNLISGNIDDNILFDSSGANLVQGNLIGTTADGSKALDPTASTTAGISLNNGSTGVTIGGINGGEGNVISGNAGHGILIQGRAVGVGPLTNSIVVLGNFIGTNADGSAAVPNGDNGIAIIDGAFNNTVGGSSAGAGNVISGNGADGVLIEGNGTTGNVIAGNLIGTDGDGKVDLGNAFHGVEISATTNNTVGGTAPGAGNLISGNDNLGVALDNEASGNSVVGNLIGTDSSGNAALGNTFQGVGIFNGGANNTIGGAAPGSRNIISGNGNNGIAIFGANTTANVVQGNYIGTNATGTAAVGNAIAGIYVGEGQGFVPPSPGLATDNTIGGAAPGAGNLIAGNATNGLLIAGDGATRTLVQGNLIGTDVNGTAAIGNTFAGVLMLGTANNTIGGLAPGTSNTIGFNGTSGVSVLGNGAVNNAILTNSIFNNKIGIDLGNDGPTPNTPGGPHVGPNNFQNFPIIAAVRPAGNGISVTGTLNSTPSTTFNLQFFADLGDASGLAEGRVFLGQQPVTTDASGNVPFVIGLEPGFAIPAGAAITATATDPNGNTSEFSVDTIVTNTNDTGFGSLRQALQNAQLSGGVTAAIRFNIPNPTAGPFKIAPNSPLPDITGPLVLDGYTQPLSSPNTLAAGDDAVINIALDGTNAGATAAGLFVASTASSVTIRGLAIGGFGESAIHVVAASAVQIAGNFLGTDAFGDVAVPNGVGVITFGSKATTIGGATVADRNIISGNSGDGIFIRQSDTATSNLVFVTNYVGTNAQGTAALPNGSNGLDLVAIANATVGGAGTAGNLFSGNTAAGIRAAGSTVSGLAIFGNTIGLASGGDAAVPNGIDGVFILNVLGFSPSGANVSLAQNVISGNAANGIHAVNSLLAVGNDKIGLSAVNPSNSTVGNARVGILLDDDLGSTISGETIAFNGGNLIGDGGIVELGTPAALFQANSIFRNNGLGIDLGGDGVTPNHPPTPPNDPNRFPNYPVITNATIDDATSTLHVEGTFDGTEDIGTFVEFFVSTDENPSGFGEGQFFVGQTSFVTDSTGHGTFSVDFKGVTSATPFISATATSFATSEFSRTFAVGLPILALTIHAAPDPVAVADVLTYDLIGQNTGTRQANNLTVTDTLPIQTSLTADSAAAITSGGGTITRNPDGTTSFHLPVGAIAVGQTRTLFTFQVIANTAGNLTDTAQLLGNREPVDATITTRAIFTFVVFNNNNSGYGSLRQAIQNADANPGVDTITFALPSNQLTIQPHTELPDISDPTILDATSQPGFAGAPIVTLDGTNVRPDSDLSGPFNGLVIRSGATTVRGLNVTNFTGNGLVIVSASGSRIINSTFTKNDTGILIQNSSANTIGGSTVGERNIVSANTSLGIDLLNASRNLIAGNFIGTDATGNAAAGNGLDGVFLENSADNTIGAGNVISGNGQVNVQIFNTGSARNVVAGNFIGTNATGTAAIARAAGDRTDVGIFINNAPANTIGGTTTAARNLVSGAGAGIELYTPGAIGNLIAGNFTGTDVTGTRPIPNSIGIFLFGSPGNTISGNLASGNDQVGIRIDGLTATNNQVRGNIAGLDASATAALPNGSDGIFLVNAPGNLIGGTTPGSANILTGNRSVGIQIFGADASANRVEGNLIGAAPNNTEPGNGIDGVFLNNAPRNTIGGTTPGSGNVISGNRKVGIQISGQSAIGNVILGNTLRNNAQIGIASENAEGNTILIRGAGANIVIGSPIPFQPVPTPGPTASVVTPTMQGAKISAVSITFGDTISPARARDKRAYRVEILNLRGKKIGSVLIRSAAFDLGTHTVTLTFAKAVPAGRSYRVIALGTGKRALTDTGGHKLDGAGTGGSGTDFVAKFGKLAAAKTSIAARSVPKFRHAAAFARSR